MTVKEQVLGILEKNKGQAVSGAKMAQELGVSRNAVWKSIKELCAQGYSIASNGQKGYCLAEDNSIFSAQSVEAFLTRENLSVQIFEELDSTNRLAKQKGEEGAKEGLILIANRQTLGRGRKGKTFFSPNSGLYMTILLRPEIAAEDALLITTGAAVAVSQAIESVFKQECQIKWVNDIYIGGKKVCGILTEASLDFEAGGLSYAALGIGVNLSDPEGGFPEDIQNIAVSLKGQNACTAKEKSLLAAEICNRFFEIYDRLPQKTFMEEYRSRSYLIGKPINVLSPNSTRQAVALDVDENAHLLVEYPTEPVKLFLRAM